MDGTIINTENISNNYKTHTTWTYWYHNPVDKNWDLSSYSKIYEFDNLIDYCKMENSWNKCLPNISDGMFFLMRRLRNGNYINPLWEDKYNKNGGFWSFKINKGDAEVIWRKPFQLFNSRAIMLL